MSGYKTDQCRLLHRGREFHFVSYEGRVANLARAETALPPMWYLMIAGKRYEVMPEAIDKDAAARDRFLAAWLDANVFPEVVAIRVPPPPRRRRSA